MVCSVEVFWSVTMRHFWPRIHLAEIHENLLWDGAGLWRDSCCWYARRMQHISHHVTCPWAYYTRLSISIVYCGGKWSGTGASLVSGNGPLAPRIRKHQESKGWAGEVVLGSKETLTDSCQPHIALFGMKCLWWLVGEPCHNLINAELQICNSSASPNRAPQTIRMGIKSFFAPIDCLSTLEGSFDLCRQRF